MDFEALYLEEKKQNAELLNEIRLLREQVEYLTKKLFGSHSEKTEARIGQLSLFDEAEVEADPNAVEPIIEEVITKIKKRKGLKEDKLKDFPHEKIVHDIDDDQKICSYCGKELSCIGESFVRTEVIFHPAKLTVVDHYVKTYECRKCRNTDNAFYLSALVPRPVIPHSYAHSSSVAYVMYQKYVNHMPLYRQEEYWKNLGLALTRQTMSNWVMIAANDWLKPVVNRMREILLSQNYLHADETTVMVLNEENRKNTTKSYMWVFGTVKESKTPIRIFKYAPTRRGDTAKDFLSGFHGYLITDAYDGYEKVEDITRCYCWAHLRRYFMDAIPSNIENLEDTAPVKAIKYCNKVFEIEREIEKLNAEEKKKVRQEKSKPIVDEFFSWIGKNQNKYLSKSKLGSAFIYASNQQNGLRRFLEDGNIPLSNNIAENAIRPFTVGRKNWMFSGSPRGAEASAIVYSIIETAKANNLNPYKYLLALLQELPKYEQIKDSSFYDEYMPWNEDIQEACK